MIRASRIYIQRFSSSTAVKPEYYFATKYKDLKHEPLFNKVLVANRGEIACRIISTCRRLGVPSLAVYSEPDSNSLHVRMADESVCIGPAAARDSYLRMDKILEVCKSHGVDAVHPGFGFLSENTEFAHLLSENGVKFIGPPSSSIKAMGDKIESKRIALAAGVNMIPGYDGAVENAETAVKIANDIGYPVMLKASAGGGGKGMRVAWNDKECLEGFRLSAAEAKSSFGDDRILIEKFIASPRHIEIQVLLDEHGNGVFLHERECSIQRRNQKVIEEAPSPFVHPEMRNAMGAQALDLARAVGYQSAGTVEFLVDDKKQFYFLEMNTRLQVEHPITECITGVDIVHQMLRIARGYPLSFTQSDLALRGSALECRIYAEDATKHFGTPSTGRLHTYVEPETLNVRCDSGVDEGSEIGVHYDPMICKLVTYGNSRQTAIDNMTSALDHYVIRGITHNIPLLRTCINEEKFKNGDITTKYLYETFPDGFKGHQLNSVESRHLSAIAACLHFKSLLRLTETSYAHGNVETLSLQVQGNSHNISLVSSSNNKFVLNIDGTQVQCSLEGHQPIIQAHLDDSSYTVQLSRQTNLNSMDITFLGTTFPIEVYGETAAVLKARLPEKPKKDVSRQLIAPMSGMLISVAVKEGDQVYSGQEVCVLEAMKMQNSLTIQADGKVKKIHITEGQPVSDEDLILELE